MRFSHFLRITFFFLFIKGLQCLLVVLTSAQFDTSSQIILKSKEILQDKAQLIRYNSKFQLVIEKFLDKLVIWDNVYFTKLFKYGITYEHEYVFCPLWWRFISNIPLKNNNFYSRLILGVLLSNLSNYFSVLVLYVLTTSVFKKFNIIKDIQRFALITCLLFIMNPAGVFLITSYLESLATLLTFISLYLREISMKNNDTENSIEFKRYAILGKFILHFIYILSSIFLSIGIQVRLNVIFVGYLYLYDFISSLRKLRKCDAIVSLASGMILFSSLVLANYIPFENMCPDRTIWCNKLVPSFFKFAQANYWNVGFLQYYTSNNIPNFIIAAPMILLIWKSVRTLESRYYFMSLISYYHYTIIFLLVAMFNFHVQILVRISGFLALPYWYLALKLVEFNNKNKLIGKVFNSNKLEFFDKSIITWMFLYPLIQSVLFAAFLPPA